MKTAMNNLIKVTDIIPAGIKLERISSSEYMGLNSDYSVYVAEMEGSFLVSIDSKKTSVMFSVEKTTGKILPRRLTPPK